MRPQLGALQDRLDTRPVSTAAALYAGLAAVRLGGAVSDLLVVASVLLTPAVLLAVPRGSWADVGLRRPRSGPALAAGVLAVMAAYALVVLACVLAFGTGPDNWMSGVRTLFTGLAPGRPVLAVVTAVVCLGLLVPLAEEVCFRGVLHQAVARRWGSGAAVLLVSAAWALVHLGDYGLRPYNGQVVAGVLPSVYVMGLALGWCRVVTGSVVACVVAQGCANLLLLAWVFAAT